MSPFPNVTPTEALTMTHTYARQTSVLAAGSKPSIDRRSGPPVKRRGSTSSR